VRRRPLRASGTARNLVASSAGRRRTTEASGSLLRRSTAGTRKCELRKSRSCSSVKAPIFTRLAVTEPPELFCCRTAFCKASWVTSRASTSFWPRSSVTVSLPRAGEKGAGVARWHCRSPYSQSPCRNALCSQAFDLPARCLFKSTKSQRRAASRRARCNAGRALGRASAPGGVRCERILGGPHGHLRQEFGQGLLADAPHFQQVLGSMKAA